MILAFLIAVNGWTAPLSSYSNSNVSHELPVLGYHVPNYASLQAVNNAWPGDFAFEEDTAQSWIYQCNAGVSQTPGPSVTPIWVLLQYVYTPTRTFTPTPTATQSTPTITNTFTPTNTFTKTNTSTVTLTPTGTLTPATNTITPSYTSTKTYTVTGTNTSTGTPTPTQSPTPAFTHLPSEGNDVVLIGSTEGLNQSGAITYSGGQANFDEITHGYAAGDWVVIAEATPDAYNIMAQISSTTTNTFTYSCPGNPTSPSTGTAVVEFWFSGARSINANKIKNIIYQEPGIYELVFQNPQPDAFYSIIGNAIVNGVAQPVFPVNLTTTYCQVAVNGGGDANYYLYIKLSGIQ